MTVCLEYGYYVEAVWLVRLSWSFGVILIVVEIVRLVENKLFRIKNSKNLKCVRKKIIMDFVSFLSKFYVI